MINDPPSVPENADERARMHLQFRLDTTMWVRDQLEEEDTEWLRRLPFSYRISPTSMVEDDLLIVHANPKDVHQGMHPTADEQESKLGSVPFEQTDGQLIGLLEGTEAATIAFGHIHFPYVREFNGMTLANISSVSNPMDGDARAKYGLLCWKQGSGWSIELNHLEYDIQYEQTQLRTRQPPKWDDLSAMLDGELFLG